MGRRCLRVVVAVVVAATIGCEGAADPSLDGGVTVSQDGSRPPPPPPPRRDAGPVVLGDPGCGLDAAAFCETFDTPSPGGRGGDLDERRFAFSRWSHTRIFFDRPAAWSRRPNPPDCRIFGDFDPTYEVQRNTPTFCGELFENLAIGEDARVCPGVGVDGRATNQFAEVFDDANDFAINSFMVRQPFDFADGGTLVFDVDGKRNPYYEGHGWWFELWITEDPAPIPYHTAPTVSAFPRNGLGVVFAPMGTCLTMRQSDCNEVASIFVTRDHEVIHEYSGDGAFPTSGGFVARDGEMNHFEVRLSRDRMEIWGTDAGSTELRRIQVFDDLDLAFDVGYVHFQHSHYNAFKDGRPMYDSGVWASHAQVYRWDNIGFDGPVRPTLRSYDVPDNDRRFRLEGCFPQTDIVEYGYSLTRGPVTLAVEGVDLAGAERALLNFNVNEPAGRAVHFRVNGRETIEYRVPDYHNPGTNSAGLRALTMEVPLEHLVPGRNTIEVSMPDANTFEMIGNVDLSLVVR